MEFQHVPVLLQETIEGLNIKPNGIYVDGTAGGAGHSSQIAMRLDPQQGGRLISIDKDPDAIQTATQRLAPYPAAQVVRGDFKDIPQILDSLGVGRVDGILLDLGVSSRQLDTAQRGFSYHFDSRLDMRMSQQGLSAYDVVNTYPQEELIRILRDYGEEKFAPRIAAAIVQAREEKPVETRNIRQVVGLDFSMKELYVDSNGKHAGYPHYFRNSEEKLAKAQRKLSHCRKGSNRYKKQQKKVARIHTHIAHQRKDYLHKESRKITNFYDIVCIEDLDLKMMSGEHHFGKSVHDNGWRMFTDFLQYKLEREGKKLVRIDRWYPSSRTCSCCGKIKHDLKLEDRVYLCSCGNRMDRDENAAVNICREGLRMSGIILEKSEKAS